VSEIWQQNENLARHCCIACLNYLCGAQNRFDWRRLVGIARLLCCVCLDAAMHNRSHGTARKLDSIFGSHQRSIKPMHFARLNAASFLAGLLKPK
jgi:hypothetical protein